MEQRAAVGVVVERVSFGLISSEVGWGGRREVGTAMQLFR